MENNGQINPYQTPQTAIELNSEAVIETYKPRMLETKGRIRRSHYFIYNMGILGLLYLVMIAGGLMLGLVGFDINNDDIITSLVYLVPTVLLIGLYFFYYLTISKRRLHDLDHSGWWGILHFVPVANMFLWGYMQFIEGGLVENKYGLPAEKGNTRWVVVVVALFIILCIVGILAAIAIPAYQGYIEAARAAAG